MILDISLAATEMQSSNIIRRSPTQIHRQTERHVRLRKQTKRTISACNDIPVVTSNIDAIHIHIVENATIRDLFKDSLDEGKSDFAHIQRAQCFACLQDELVPLLIHLSNNSMVLCCRKK